MTDWVPLVSGFGLGAVFQAVVQHLLGSRKYVRERSFAEKKEAYLGFLLAVHESEIKQTIEASKNVGHWRSVCELFAPESVNRTIAQIFETNPIDGTPHPDRPEALARMKAAMKADLERT